MPAIRRGKCYFFRLTEVNNWLNSSTMRAVSISSMELLRVDSLRRVRYREFSGRFVFKPSAAQGAYTRSLAQDGSRLERDVMPIVMLVPYVPVRASIFLFSVAYRPTFTHSRRSDRVGPG